MEFSKKLLDIKKEVLKDSAESFALVDEIAEKNTQKVLEAMTELKISAAHFSATNGYAYDDMGRSKIDELYAKVFKAEKALVRTQFVSGTHALAAVLFGVLRPGDELVSLTGAPYDTMRTVIGTSGNANGSLKEFGIAYKELPLRDGKTDIAAIKNIVSDRTKLVLVQRSRGYGTRAPLFVADIEAVSREVKRVKPDCIVFVDNCYGEFVEEREPTEAGADIMAGSLIKNPGGGIAPAGGYVAGRAALVDAAANRLTAPGLGDELGASLAGNRLILQGFFLAPHVTAQAVKGAIFAAGLFSRLGFRVFPAANEKRSDIIQAIELKSVEKVAAFCNALQKVSPIDSFAVPVAAPMPGYADKIIMAAGTFVQGASIEISADAPMREPYNVYLQGGLTFEHAVIAAMNAARETGEIA